MRLGELEGIVGEEDGYTAESDAAILLQGLDIPDELHERQDGASCRAARRCACCWRRRCSATRRRCCSTSRPTTSTSTRSTGCEEFLDALRGHADRHLARPPLPERGLHAHRRHRLPDDHHLHRRLRRHGDGEDADPRRASRRRTRSARRRSRSCNDFIAALLRRHPRQPGAEPHPRRWSGSSSTTWRGRTSRAVHQVRAEAPVGEARARDQGRLEGLRRQRGDRSRSARSSTAARRSASSAGTAWARRRCEDARRRARAGRRRT